MRQPVLEAQALQVLGVQRRLRPYTAKRVSQKTFESAKKIVDTQKRLCKIRASLEGTVMFIRHRSLKINQAIRVGAD